MKKKRILTNGLLYTKPFFLTVLLAAALFAFSACSKTDQEKKAAPVAGQPRTALPEHPGVHLDPAREHFNKGVKYAINGKYDEAIEEYKKTIKLNPRSAEAYNNLGFAYLDKGDIDNAIKSQEKAIALKQKLTVAYYGLAQALERKGDKKAALNNWKEFVKRSDPKSKWYAKAQEKIKALEGKKK